MGGGILSRHQIQKKIRLRRAEKHCFQCFWSSLVATDGTHSVVHHHMRWKGDREVVRISQTNNQQQLSPHRLTIYKLFTTGGVGLETVLNFISCFCLAALDKVWL